MFPCPRHMLGRCFPHTRDRHAGLLAPMPSGDFLQARVIRRLILSGLPEGPLARPSSLFVQMAIMRLDPGFPSIMALHPDRLPMPLGPKPPRRQARYFLPSRHE